MLARAAPIVSKNHPEAWGRGYTVRVQGSSPEVVGEGGRECTEPVFVNVYGAQKSIPRSRFCQAGNLFLGSLKGLQIPAQV